MNIHPRHPRLSFFPEPGRKRHAERFGEFSHRFLRKRGRLPAFVHRKRGLRAAHLLRQLALPQIGGLAGAAQREMQRGDLRVLHGDAVCPGFAVNARKIYQQALIKLLIKFGICDFSTGRIVDLE